MKNKKTEDELAKLVKLTKLLKQDNVSVAPKSPPKAANKWRGQKPTFTPKTETPTNLVDGGGMQVDPTRKDEYDAWRQSKLEEQNYRIEARQKKAEAARKRRAEEKPQI